MLVSRRLIYQMISVSVIVVALMISLLLINTVSAAAITKPLPASNKPLVAEILAPAKTGANTQARAPEATRNLKVTKLLKSNAGKAGPGNLIVYRIYVKNEGNSTAANIRITDTLPISVTYVDTWGDSNYTIVMTGSQLVWTRDNLDANSHGYIYYSARIDENATPGAVLTNVVQGTTTSPETDYTDNIYTVTTAVQNASLDLGIYKLLDSSPSLDLSKVFYYEIQFENDGTTPAQNVIITDTLPDGIDIVNWEGAMNNPSPIDVDLNDTVSMNRQGQQLVWTLGNLEGGASGSLELEVKFTTAVTSGDVYTNIAQISTTSVETNTNANIATHVMTIPYPSVDLGISKQLGYGSQAVPNGEMTYKIKFENYGVTTATNVIITDTFPLSVTYLSFTGRLYNPTQYNIENSITPIISGNQVIWHLGNLAAGQYGYLYPTVKVSGVLTGGDILTNVARISTTSVETNTQPNVATNTTTVQALERDLHISKWGGSQGSPGGSVDYTISFRNNGVISATNVVITDTLPPTMTLASWHGVLYRSGMPSIDLDETISPTISGNEIVWNIGVMDANWTGYLYPTVNISNTAVPGTSLINRVAIYTPDSETNVSNNSSSVTTQVVTGTQDLFIRKTLNNDAPPPGGVIRYKIYFKNEGTLSTRAIITDVLPAKTSLLGWNGYAYLPNYTKLEETAVATITNASIIWDIGELRRNQYGYINVVLKVDDQAQIGDVLTNTAYIAIGATETDTEDNDSVQRTIISQEIQDVAIRKSLDIPGVPGGDIFYKIRFSNNGNVRAEDVLITDTLPVSTSFISWSGSIYGSGYADLTQLVQPTVTDKYVVWHLPYLEADGDGYIYVKLKVDENAKAGDVLTNTAQISINDTEQNYTNNIYTVTDALVGEDIIYLDIYKDLINNPGYPGGEMSYGIEFYGAGNTPPENLVITDTLPAELEFVSWQGEFYDNLAPYTSIDLTQVATLTVTGKQLVWRFGQLSESFDAYIQVQTEVTDTASVGDSIVNQVKVTADNVTYNQNYHFDEVTTQLISYTRDLYVNKYLTGNYGGTPGGTMEYHIRVDNEGNTPAHNVRITDTLPSGVSLLSWRGEMKNPHTIDLDQTISVTQTGSQLVWVIPEALISRSSGGGIDIYVQVQLANTLQVGEVLVNKVEVSSSDAESDYNNNTDLHAATVATNALDLTILQQLADTTVFPGKEVSYRVSYNNVGNSPASGVRITDTLDSGVAYVSSQNANGTLTPSVNGNTVVWNIGNLAAAASGEFTVTVRTPNNLGKGDTMVNQIDISANEPDVFLYNNRSIQTASSAVASEIYLPLILK